MPPPGMKAEVVNLANVTTHKAETRSTYPNMPVPGDSGDKHFDRMKFQGYQQQGKKQLCLITLAKGSAYTYLNKLHDFNNLYTQHRENRHTHMARIHSDPFTRRESLAILSHGEDIYIYTYIHTYTHIYIHIHIYIYIYIYIHSHMARIYGYTLIWRGSVVTLSRGEDIYIYTLTRREYISTLSHGEDL
jgi:hypothetical protein